MPRRLASRTLPAVALALAALAPAASGQFGGMGGGLGFNDRPKELKAPSPFQVIQRGDAGLGDIPVTLADDLKGSEIAFASILGMEGARLADGVLRGVPVGGPYTIQVTLRMKDKTPAEFHFVQVPQVYVGDLWVLAGQSNMEGVGDLLNVTPPHNLVRSLGMDGRWVQAKEPLHWLVDSPDPVHSGDPATRAERSEALHRTRTKGAGLGLAFASAMVNATAVPVGLVTCAHGGTSLEQWSPSKKGEGGKSLYGSMLRQVTLAGGKVKGVLWYQGESDALKAGGGAAFPKLFADFVAAVRADLGRPDLPFYYVQIGRFVVDRDPNDWHAIREAQRKAVETIPVTAVVSVMDLELGDAIHVGTSGLKRLGERLARVALRNQFGQPGATTPTLDRVSKGPGNSLVVTFRGVNRSPTPLSGVGPAPGRSYGGLGPDRHVVGFSIRKADGSPLPLIYEAMVGPSRDAVILKLTGTPPEGASLWYGWGLDPVCNLVDTLDMAVPAFGPIGLDGVK